MHSAMSRISNAGALATTVLLTILALVSTTTLLLPNAIDSDATTLRIHHLNVVKGRSQWDRRAKEREFAFVKFDLKADLKPLFNWNTKQVFVSLVADYSTPRHPENSVVVWDRIMPSARHARLNIQDGRQKYEFKEISDSFANVSATFSLHYQIQPHVGFLTHGEIVTTEPIAFPPVRTRSQ
ncbi:hypothetical protein JCM10212_001810 [Sporobolomyces blumeae]